MMRKKKKNREKYKPYSVCDFHLEGPKQGLGSGSSVGHAEVCLGGWCLPISEWSVKWAVDFLFFRLFARISGHAGYTRQPVAEVQEWAYC